MTDTVTNEPRGQGEHHVEATLEANTMALYVSVVLLAALAATKDSSHTTHAEMLGIIWGTTIGLALAHLFAFRLSSRLVRGTAFHADDVELAISQLGGAAAVAVLCTIPVLLFPAETESDVVRLLLGVLLGIAGYAAGRTAGASRPRALVTGAVALVLGETVALLKNLLVGH